MRMAEELAQEEVTDEEISLFKPPFKVGDTVWGFELPDMESRKVKLSDYKGKVIIERRGRLELHGILSFQGCTKNQCLPPKRQEFTLSFYVLRNFIRLGNRLRLEIK